MEYTTEELLDLWLGAYLRMHASWAPVSDADATREVFRGVLAETLDVERTFVACVDMQPIAVTFLNYLRILETIPHRSAGALTPMEMVRIDPVGAGGVDDG